MGCHQSIKNMYYITDINLNILKVIKKNDPRKAIGHSRRSLW